MRTPTTTPLEEVVVSGIRHSIETSIATKREATSVVEVVSAEDIGKLPDTSIADSIARLPGVTAQRIEGRPAAISIRGLSEDYAGALLNGRQVVSSSEGRSAEYDQFPSELVNQVIGVQDRGRLGGRPGPVGHHRHPAADAAQPQSPASSLFLPAPRKIPTVALSSTGKGEYGNRFSASYVDQFADDTIGVAIGFAHLDSPGQAKNSAPGVIGDYNGQWGLGATGVPSADGSSGDCVFWQ